MYLPSRLQSVGGAAVVLLLFMWSRGVAAQDFELIFGRVPLPGGAYGNYVTSIAQDERGFMWFGTWGGLHRFDGYEVRTFVSDPDHPGSLSKTWVESLYVDSDGNLWVGTYGGGLNLFDPELETFTAYQNVARDSTSISGDIVTVMHEQSDGRFWVGTHSGLNLFDRKTGTFRRYQNDPSDSSTLSDDQVRALYEDRGGTLWIGTGSPSDPPYGRSGLNRFDPDTDSFTHYVHEPGDPTSLIDSQVRAILEDSNGRFWVGTWGDGLHTMDRKSGRFTRHAYDPNNPTALSRPHLRDDPGRGGVNFIFEDRSGIIWIGAVNGGVNRYDPARNLLMHYEGDPDVPNSLGENRVWTIFESRDGTLWIGTLGSLHKVDTAIGNFDYYHPGPTDFDNATRAFAEGRGGDLWIGTSSGLHLMSAPGAEGDRLRYRGEQPRSLRDARIHSLLVDRERALWIGTWEQGLYRYQPDARRLEHLTGEGLEVLTTASVMALHEDSSGDIWIGTAAQGLGRLNPSRRTLQMFTHDPGDPASLGQNSIRCIREDGRGVIWVGSDGGLSSFDGDSFRTFVYSADDSTSIGDNIVTSIAEDSQGHLWIGTESGGLNRYDPATDSFERFTTENSGLPADGILSVEAGVDGNIWISSDRGLTRLSPIRKSFNSFGAEFGLPAEPFYGGSAFQNSRGTMFVGGRNGFHVFVPSDIAPVSSPAPPQIALTNLLLFGQQVRPGHDSPLSASITETETLTLTHSQNDLTFGFAALHFRRPEGNQYSYLMTPYQENWTATSFIREARFTNLDPGDYTFRVRGGSSDGVWNEEGAAIRIVIDPPVWATWWFRIGLTLLLVGLAVGVYQLRIRQIREHNTRLAQEVADRTRELEHSLNLLTQAQDQLVHADKMASLGQLVAGIAHEIKNPLNFVNNFAELSVELTDQLALELDEASEAGLTDEQRMQVEGLISDLRDNVRRINQHGSRADGIVKSMLDHSRGQAGERSAVDLNALLEQYANLAYHGMRARHSTFNVMFETDYDPLVGMVQVVPQEMGRVFVNLLNNALDALQLRKESEPDFTPIIQLKTVRKGNFVEVSISDNGPGVPVETRYKIFEPFFTTKPMGAGTGLGLSLSYEIVTQGHGGSLTLDDNEQGGAVFTITLPG
ncbi:MAG: hypothetical protein KJO98_04255 [Rhodothermia bacterium]|nr:hypothetical protein [Rhodothermia bacterium]